MPKFIEFPTKIEAAGNKPKTIKEIVGIVNTKTSELSIAHMNSPYGWVEPAQIPEFDEYTYVLKGCLYARFKDETYKVKPGQCIIAYKGEWVQYSTPEPEGADYIAICLPAFSPRKVHRES